MKVLVTGGSGFIGTNLVEYLTSRGDVVINVDLNPPRNIQHERYWRRGNIEVFSEFEAIAQDFQPEYIIHLAARTDLEGRTVDDYKANTIGVENVAEVSANLNSLRRIVFASSRLVCKIGYQPKSEDDYCATTAYGESKVVGERIVRQYNDRLKGRWTLVRPTSIWGPWFGIPYKDFFTSVRKGRYVHPGKMNIEKSFGYVGNSVFQLSKIMVADDVLVQGKTLYLTDYPPLNVRSFANEIQRQFGAKKIPQIPVFILRVAAKIGDLARSLGWTNPPLTSFRLDNLLMPMFYETADLERVVGELPFTLNDGIRNTVAWMNDPANR